MRCAAPGLLMTKGEDRSSKEIWKANVLPTLALYPGSKLQDSKVFAKLLTSIVQGGAASRPGGEPLVVTWLNRATHPVTLSVLDYQGPERDAVRSSKLPQPSTPECD